MSPPNSALWPTRFSSLRKVESAMIRETFVLSICAMIHRNKRAGATSSHRRLSSQFPVPAFPASLAIHRLSPTEVVGVSLRELGPLLRQIVQREDSGDRTNR